MSGIGIYPPIQLPAWVVTDFQFKIWKEELEVDLETEDKFEPAQGKIQSLDIRKNRNDVILWKSKTLTGDEKITSSHKDLVLLHALTLVHSELPAFVKEQCSHKMGQYKLLMNLKTEILTKARPNSTFKELTICKFSTSIEDPEYKYMQTRYQPPYPNFHPRTSQYTPRLNLTHPTF